ncbi:T9SS type A sorting domain-containing protein [Flavobacterium sp.]|uniref:T9SS type A sorting domain-containing protein n=1 Tax=Flavobacterium sp. TaxID=239 RepID=UPI003A94459E
MYVQSDNSLLVGGRFEYMGRECLVRVNSQGVIDSGFNFQTPGETTYPQGVTDGDFEVRDIAIQPTPSGDKILLVGRSMTGDPHIYRINYTTGAIDNTFNTNGANDAINSIAVLPNGDLIVVGEFTTYNGYSRNKIARLDSNGNVQSNYNYTGASGDLYTVELDSNNRILIGGTNTLKRLNSDLTVDNSFASSVTGEIVDIDLFNDGNIMVCGNWTNLNGTTISSQLAKMNDTGTLDPCFTDYSIYSQNQPIYAIAIASDAVFVGTVEGSYQGVPHEGTIKIKGNTATINAVDDIGTTVYSNNGGVAVTNVLGGSTPDTVNNENATLSNVTLTQVSTTNPGVTLNTSNGSVNVAPNTPSGSYTLVYKICMQGSTCNCDEAEVTVTVSETLATINAAYYSTVLSSNENWSLSIGSYNNAPATSQNVSIEFLTPLPPGFYLDSLGANIEIDPSTPMGTYSYQYKICDLNAPNNCDTGTVNIALTTEGLYLANINNTVKISGYQSDQKAIIIGDFTSPGNKIARLDGSLSMDSSFNHQGPSPATAVPRDMKISNYSVMVVGGFNGFNGGSNGKGIAKLNHTTGNIDPYYNQGGSGVAGGTEEIYCIDEYSGYYFIAGSFTSYNGTPINSIAKISNYTGALDTSFNPGSGFGGGVPYDIITTNNGYIIAVGSFTSYKGTPVNKIVRIKPNGDLDTSFSAGITGNYIEDIISIPPTGGAGGYFITGDFSYYNGVSRKNIARIDLNGNLITAFNPGSGFNGIVRSIAYKESAYPFEPSSSNGSYQVGTIYVGGDFTIYNGQPVKKVVRLRLNGQIEQSFQDGVGFGPSLSKVYTLSVQPDNFLLIAGGQFTSYNTYNVNNLVRLQGCSSYIGSGLFIGGIGRPLPSEESDITNEIETQLLPETFISEKNILIYPNPSNGIFNLKVDGYSGEDFEIEVFNPLGQVIFKNNISGQSTYQMDLSTMAAGNYFVRIQNNNTVINKIIVKK